MIVDGVKVKTIPEFPDYAISHNGMVWSKPKRGWRGCPTRGKWMKLWKKNGYWSVWLRREKKRHQRYIHRLVLETYIGLCPAGMECRHLNGNREDNGLVNLCWGTHTANCQDTVKHNRVCRGEKHNWSKLTEEQVRVIFHAYHDGYYSVSDIASAFGISVPAVCDIAAKRNWGYLWT